MTGTGRVELVERGSPTGREQGSASIWVLACAALLFLVALTIVIRTSATLARHRAETAADAAALAAAGQIGVSESPCATATRIAGANGAVLRSCQLTLAANARSGQVAVVVGIDVNLPFVGHSVAMARARAQRDPS